MAVSQYRLTVIGPGDEVLDEVPLDGLDLNNRGHQAEVGLDVSDSMGSHHRAECAKRPDPRADG